MYQVNLELRWLKMKNEESKMSTDKLYRNSRTSSKDQSLKITAIWADNKYRCNINKIRNLTLVKKGISSKVCMMIENKRRLGKSKSMQKLWRNKWIKNHQWLKQSLIHDEKKDHKAKDPTLKFSLKNNQIPLNIRIFSIWMVHQLLFLIYL